MHRLELNLFCAELKMLARLVKVVCVSWVMTSFAAVSAQSAETYGQVYQTARQSMNEKRYSESYDRARQAVKIDGSRWEAYDLAGTALLDLQKPKDALGYFQRALRRAPESAKADIRKAIYACQAMAAAGHASAMSSVGHMYETGHQLPRDAAQAMTWYRKAAGSGDPEALGMLGDMYANGRGVPQDYAQAASWYRKAAAASDLEAMKRLGDMYGHEQGVPRDHALSQGRRERSASGEQSRRRR